jgi:cytidine deaminase
LVTPEPLSLAKKVIYIPARALTLPGGFCAERSAMVAMITDGEYKIQKVVAV